MAAVISYTARGRQEQVDRPSFAALEAARRNMPDHASVVAGIRFTTRSLGDQGQKRTRARANANLPLQTLAAVINSAAYRWKLLGTFVERCGQPGQCGGSEAWILQLPSLSGSFRSISLANLALSCASLARESGDKAFLKVSSLFYYRALIELRRELYIPGADTGALLAACVAMLYYHVSSEDTGMSDVSSHVDGMAAILRFTGASGFMSGAAHHIFGPSRLCIIHLALYRPEGPGGTFLASNAWKTIPWKKESKTEYDHLIDHFADMPALMWRCIDLAKHGGRQYQSTARRALILEIWSRIRAMRGWWSQVSEPSKPGKLVPTNVAFGAVSRTRAFPHSYLFADCSSAAMSQMYHGGLLYLYTMLNSVYLTLQGIETTYLAREHPAALRCQTCYAEFIKTCDPALNGCHCGWIFRQLSHAVSDLPRPLQEYDLLDAASNICMAMMYCVSPSSRFMDAHRAMWALQMAQEVYDARLPTTKSEVRWCGSVLQTLGQSETIDSFCEYAT